MWAMPKASLMGGAKRYRSLVQFCCELCYHVFIQAWEDDIHPAKDRSWESTDTMNRPMNCSTHRCLAQDQTSDKALSSDPFAIAKCVLPFLHKQHRTQARSGTEWREFACKGVLSYSSEHNIYCNYITLILGEQRYTQYRAPSPHAIDV